MGLVRKKNVADYWAKNHPSTYVPFFATVMSFRLFRFYFLCTSGCYPDAPVRLQDGIEPWNKVRPVLDAVRVAIRLLESVQHNRLARIRLHQPR